MKAVRIFALLDRKPFRPFTIELDSGHRIRVKHPENLIPIPDRPSVDFFIAVIPGRERRYFEFEPTAVIALERGNGE